MCRLLNKCSSIQLCCIIWKHREHMNCLLGMCKITSIISIIVYALWEVVWCELTRLSSLRTYSCLSHYHHQIANINHKSEIRIGSRINCVCCMTCYILIDIRMSSTDMSWNTGNAFKYMASWHETLWCNWRRNALGFKYNLKLNRFKWIEAWLKTVNVGISFEYNGCCCSKYGLQN